MRDTPPHLKALEEIECEGTPGLVKVLSEEGIDAVRHVTNGLEPLTCSLRRILLTKEFGRV